MKDKILDVYHVKEEIGRGGMGRVYRAIDIRSGISVAIKIVDCPDLQMLQRFRREAQTLSKLSHPNIVQILSDLCQYYRSIYFVMEYVPGYNLGEILKRLGRIDVPLALSITSEILKALILAHRQSIIHRDLKPSNILLANPFKVKLSDFGLSLDTDTTRFTRSGHFLGTPAYISPEQGEGLEVDQRSDIYSLGIMLYEMLTGKVPFVGPVLAVLRQHRIAPFPLPSFVRADISSGVENLILKAVSKDPSDRFQTSQLMLEQVEELRKLYGVSIQQKELQRILTPPTFSQQIIKFKWRYMILFILIFLCGDRIYPLSNSMDSPFLRLTPENISLNSNMFRKIRIIMCNGKEVQGRLVHIGVSHDESFSSAIILQSDNKIISIPLSQIETCYYMETPNLKKKPGG